MSAYRTSRPMIVDAAQCKEAKTIATDLGFIHVKQGEWVISGEDGETYIVDDAFFQRTFVSVQANSGITEDKPIEDAEQGQREEVPRPGPGPRPHRSRIRSTHRLVRRRRFPVSR